MASDWQRVRTADVAAHMAAGPFGSAIGMKHFCESGVPIIRGSNLSNEVGRRLSDEGLVFLREEKAAEFTRSEAKRGDLVFTCWGTIDQVGLIDERSRYESYIVSNKQMLLSPDRKRVNSLFLYYLFSSPQSRSEILNQGIGSSVPGFNLGQLKAFEVLLPPLPEQKRIAHILGTLDDKIELNRRMNATLEAMSRAIFKSWFVDFDPVRQKAAGQQPVGMDAKTAALFPDSFEDSEIGEVPMGWGVGCLSDVAEHPRRAARPREIASGTPYIGLEHMPRRCIALSDWGTGDDVESNKFEFQRGEILFGKLRPYFHKVGVAPVDGVCSTDIVVARPRSPKWFGFVLGHMSSDVFVAYTTAGSTGTKMPRTNWEDMARYEAVLPPDSVAEAFSDIVQGAVASTTTRTHQSRTLAALRDTLLPKLLSGEIRSPEAEQAVEEATA
jgi:type I restriction enzyme S subunit